MGSHDHAAPASGGAPQGAGAGSWFPCPYCGAEQRAGAAECTSCAGLFEPLSRQATQNHMGPWQVRDVEAPFMPGRSYATIRRMAQRGKIAPDDVLRGPTTRQFWMAAAEIPGVAHLLGRCHACKGEVKADAFSCDQCGAAFPTPEDRQSLGLAPVRLLPGQAPPVLVARSASAGVPESAGSPPKTGTAFAALSRTAPPAATPRPSEPSRLQPAASAGAPSVPAVSSSPAPDSSRALRVAHRRVSVLKGVVVALVVVNVVLVVVAAASMLSAGGSGDAPAEPRETAPSSE